MRIYAETHTLFSEGQNGLKMMVSGLNDLLGRVKRSDSVQSGRDTSPDGVGGPTRGPGVHAYTLKGRLLLRSARSVLAAYQKLAYKHLSPTFTSVSIRCARRHFLFGLATRDLQRPK